MAGEGGSTTLIIDADTARYIAQIAKASRATQELGRVGVKSLQGITGSMAGAITKMFTLKTLAEGMTSAFNEATKKAADMNRQMGKENVALTSSLAQLGIRNISAAQDFVQQTDGGTSLKDRASFTAALASAANKKDGSGRSKASLNPHQFYQLQAAYNYGGDAVFGPGGSDLVDLVGDKRRFRGDVGQSLRDMLSKKFGVDRESPNPLQDVINKLPKSVRREYQTVALEREQELEARASQNGVLQRRGEAILQSRRARDPGAFIFSDTVGQIPVAGGIVEAAHNASVRAQQTESKHLGDIKRATEAMESALRPRPVIGAGGERAP